MKKSLIAAAVAAMVITPSANANVTIFGTIHASIDAVDIRFTHNFDEFSNDAWSVSSRSSSIGFKGTEDLGNGLSLIWKAETGYDITDGDAWSSAKNAYIGLTGDWGAFVYGIHDTPMKMSTAKLDLFADQVGDYNWDTWSNAVLLGPGFHDVRASNAIAYISPDMNGLTFAGAIIPGEGTEYDNFGSSGPKSQNGLADSYSVAAMYSNNGLYLAAAYENLMAGTFADTYFGEAGLSPALAPLNLEIREHDEAMKVWRIGAGYTINAFTLNFVYENQQFDDIGFWSDHNTNRMNGRSNYEADVWQISGAYDFGNNRVKLAYGENSADVRTPFGPVDGKSKHWAIGLDHMLSKRTTAYAQYAAMDADAEYDARGTAYSGDAEASVFSMGMIHKF